MADTASSDTNAAFDALEDVRLPPRSDVGPLKGKWHALPGRTDCAAWIADDPATSVSTLSWEPCASTPNCKRAVTDWTTASWRLEVGYPEPVRPSPAGPVLHYLRIIGNSASDVLYSIQVLQPLSGTAPIYAIADDMKGSPPRCAENLWVGPSGVLVTIAAYPPSVMNTLYMMWPGAGTESATLLPYKDLRVGGAADTVFATLSAGGVHIEIDGPRGIAVYDPVAKISRTAAKTPPASEVPLSVSSGSVSRMLNATGGLLFTSDSGSSEALVTAAADRAIWTHAIDRARADTIVWVDSDSTGTGTMLDSPFSATASGISPHPIAHVPGPPKALVANAGYVLYVKDASTAVIVRAKDGWGWTLHAPSGRYFLTPLWVTDSEVWLTDADASLSAYATTPSGIVRLAWNPSSSPDVPPGL